MSKTQVKTKYEADSGVIYKLRLSADDAAVAGTEPTGDATGGYIRARRPKESFGLQPRHVMLYRTFGTGQDAGTDYRSLVLRSKADATDPKYAYNKTITIGAQTWTVEKVVAERTVGLNV